MPVRLGCLSSAASRPSERTDGTEVVGESGDRPFAQPAGVELDPTAACGRTDTRAALFAGPVGERGLELPAFALDWGAKRGPMNERPFHPVLMA
jgi:hypothetical protein